MESNGVICIPFSFPNQSPKPTASGSGHVSTKSNGNVVGCAPTVPFFYADRENPLIQILLTPELIPLASYPLVIRGKSCVGKTLLGLTTLRKLTDGKLTDGKLTDAVDSVQRDVTTSDSAVQGLPGQHECEQDLGGEHESYSITGDDFCRRYANAIQDRVVEEFKERFLKVGFLLIDDVQHFSRFKKAQYELACLIDQRHELKKPTLLTLKDDCAAFHQLDPYLASRLNGGLNISVQMPGPDARRYLIRSIAIQMGVSLNDHVIDRLATLAPVNVVQLKTILTRIAPSLKDEHNSPESVAQLSKLFGLEDEVIESLSQRLIKQIAREYELSVSELCGRKRNSSIVAARGMAIVLLRNHFEISWNRIGGLLGGRDHSTVINGYQKTSALLQSDGAASKRYESLSCNLLLAQLEHSGKLEV